MLQTDFFQMSVLVSDALNGSDASGNITDEYIFFGGKRIARRSTTSSSTLSIQNPSFETHNPLDHPFGGGPYNLGPIPSWTTTGTSGSGSWQPNSSVFTALSDGSILGYNNSGSIAQTLTGVSLQPNSTYTLTVAIGHRLDGYVGGYTIALQAGSTVLNSFTGSNSGIAAGKFADQTLTYSTGTSVTSGDLGITLTSNGVQMDFDNVRLSVSGGSGSISYYFADHLGTARVVTNSTGTVLDDSDFYPYGGERVVSSASGNRYKFTGKERDSESGLDEFGARYYSSQYARFMVPDWGSHPEAVPYADLGNPQSLNLYSYVKNNPVTVTDADGHCNWCQELKNWLDYGHWVTNSNLNAALAADAARAAQAMHDQGVSIHGQSSDDALKGKSNQEIVDTFNRFQAAQLRGSVPSLPIPLGVNQAEFGQNVMKWGTGDEAARARMQTLTREELEKSGVTKEMAEAWRDFYKGVKDAYPENPSAAGRADLMQKAVDLLSGK